MQHTQFRAWPAAVAGLVVAAVLAACGGGGDATTPTTSGATEAALSSGSISAFGSVYVNGRRYTTGNARVIDDDTGAVSTASAAALEVGMVVDVKPASTGSTDAAELHLHPLARGIVDASDSTAGTLTVMGQTVQLTAATNYSDHRACVTATTNPCTAIASQDELTATTGTGSGATAGSYVGVHGYLFDDGSGSGNAQIIATLVSVRDVPTPSVPYAYKAEGVVSAAAGTTLTIGGLTVDLASATCRSGGTTVACSDAFAAGSIVSVGAAAQPALPAAALTAGFARAVTKIGTESAGATVELEGGVASVSGTTFVMRGLTVDGTALATMPAVGDVVRVVGTVATGGQSITATELTVLRAASSRAYGLEGDVAAVIAGTTADTYTVTVLGQSITVNANTRLADRQSRSWSRTDPTANPFNIGTFATYFAASSSQHVLVKARTDAGGNLVSQSFTILPASTVATIAGPVDAAPAPVNSSATGTPSTFSVHGVAVSADPAAIFQGRYGRNAGSVTITAGEVVVVRGSFASGTLTVGATANRSNAVIDLGVLSRRDQCGL